MSVSGYLVCSKPFFLQRLEGKAETVSALARAIKHDHRHEGFMVVERRPIRQRSYGHWAMQNIHTGVEDTEGNDSVPHLLRKLEMGLRVASQTVDPALFDSLLAGDEQQLFQVKGSTMNMVCVPGFRRQISVCFWTAIWCAFSSTKGPRAGAVDESHSGPTPRLLATGLRFGEGEVFWHGVVMVQIIKALVFRHW